MVTALREKRVLKKDLDERLRIARLTILAIHDREEKALRRRPFPAELVAAAKRDSEKLLDVIEVFQLPKARRSAVAGCGAGGPQFYATQIKAAEAILEIIAEIGDPIAIVMAFREEYPDEFAGVRYLPQYVRVVEGKNKHYFMYRRRDFETRLPDSPIGPEFMRAYQKAERAYEGRNLHQTYNARPQPLALAA